jgi:cbb3-type cytochrome oxidase subunit 3
VSGAPSMLGMSAPELSLLFFFGVFIGMVVWLLLSKSARWRRDARIPLDDLPQDEIAATETPGITETPASAGSRATREGRNHA